MPTRRTLSLVLLLSTMVLAACGDADDPAVDPSGRDATAPRDSGAAQSGSDAETTTAPTPSAPGSTASRTPPGTPPASEPPASEQPVSEQPVSEQPASGTPPSEDDSSDGTPTVPPPASEVPPTSERPPESSGTPPASEPATAEPTLVTPEDPVLVWDTDIRPLLQCRGCHGNTYGVSSVNPTQLLAFSRDVPRMRFVEPFDPDSSYLWHKLAGTHTRPDVGGRGNRMPQGGPFLTAAELDRFELWILQGAAPLEAP